MIGLDALCAGDVGGGSRHAQRTQAAAPAQPKSIAGLGEQAPCAVADSRGEDLLSRGSAGRGEQAPLPTASLQLGGRGDRRRGVGVSGRGGRSAELACFDGPHLHEQIEAVQEGAAGAQLVAAAAMLGAAAGDDRVGGEAARAGVAGCHEHHLRREGGILAGAMKTDLAILQRLPQSLEHRSCELRQLVEEQDPTVGPGDLSGTEWTATAEHTLRRDARMGRSERWAARHRADAPEGCLDLGELESAASLQIREQLRDAPGQQALSRARRTLHEQGVAPGCRQDGRPPRRRLATHVLEAELLRRSVGWGRRRGRRSPAAAAEEVRDLAEIAGAIGGHARRQRRFLRGIGSGDQPLDPAAGRHGGQERAAGRCAEASLEVELREEQPCLVSMIEASLGREQRHREGEIQGQSAFGDLRREEVEQHLPFREGEAVGAQGRRQALPGLAGDRVRHSHQDHPGESAPQERLHPDQPGPTTVERCAVHRCHSQEDAAAPDGDVIPPRRRGARVGSRAAPRSAVRGRCVW